MLPFLTSSELTKNYQDAYNDALRDIQHEIDRVRSFDSLDDSTLSFFENLIRALHFNAKRTTVFLPRERFRECTPSPTSQGEPKALK